ncbi:MAG: REP-associated tyrosine transposase [Eubacteriales bacterium]|nr:REP-associated tyrosine transposase [Eubacteriales bacterium]MDN5364074.1 REP-associated tyrosine transposase [Eubacteriales bacterium]
MAFPASNPTLFYPLYWTLLNLDSIPYRPGIDCHSEICYHDGMKKEAWKSAGTSAYNINYHFVWSTKCRRKVLLPPVDETLKKAITALCAEHGYELLALEVMPDYVHVFLSAPPKIAPAVIAKVLKGSTARTLFVKHPELRKKLWGGHLWNPSYYVGTAGQVSSDTIRRYIETQRTEAGSE